MITFLRVLFLLILASMLAVTTWASLQCPLFAVPRPVFTHPWFLATMADAYAGFVTFFVWVCYKQTGWVARGGWFLAIMLLGNIAMSCYCLAELWQTPRDGRIADIVATRRAGPGPLGLVLAALGAAVTLRGLAG